MVEPFQLAAAAAVHGALACFFWGLLQLFGSLQLLPALLGVKGNHASAIEAQRPVSTPEEEEETRAMDDDDDDEDVGPADAPRPLRSGVDPSEPDRVESVTVPSLGPPVYTQRARRRADRIARQAMSRRLFRSPEVSGFRMFSAPAGVRLHVCYATGACRDYCGAEPHAVMAAALQHTFGVDA